MSGAKGHFLLQWVTDTVMSTDLTCPLFMLQGIDTEQKEKGSKGDVTKMFGANTPTVSCFFGSKSFDTRCHVNTIVRITYI